MKKIIFPIFLLLSLIVKSQTVSIDSSLEMWFFEKSPVYILYDFGGKIYKNDTISGNDFIKPYSFDNISFKKINQSYLDDYSSDLLLMSVVDENYKIIFSQIIGIDQILELKIIIEQVYKFRKSKNFNYSFGQDLYVESEQPIPDGMKAIMVPYTGVKGNFSNGELLLEFHHLDTSIMDLEWRFINNLSLVTETGEPSLFGIESINLKQIKSLRKFLKKF
mgnify:CR=1 FL=1